MTGPKGAQTYAGCGPYPLFFDVNENRAQRDYIVRNMGCDLLLAGYCFLTVEH